MVCPLRPSFEDDRQRDAGDEADGPLLSDLCRQGPETEVPQVMAERTIRTSWAVPVAGMAGKKLAGEAQCTPPAKTPSHPRGAITVGGFRLRGQ